jgi:hypothetical protein
MSQGISTNSNTHREKDCTLGSCKVFNMATTHHFQSEDIVKISSTWLKQIFLLFSFIQM